MGTPPPIDGHVFRPGSHRGRRAASARPSVERTPAAPGGLVRLLLATLVGAACSDAAGPPHVETLDVVEFSPWATVATSIPVTIEALDRSGRPVPGVSIGATVLTEGGALAPAAGVTDAEGRWFTLWTLAPVAGDQSLHVEAGAAAHTLHATARPGSPEALVVTGGNAQRGGVGEILADSIQVEVRDRHGNPVSDVPVEIAVVDGGGHVDPTVAVTGPAGSVYVQWTLGAELGGQRLEARLTGGPSVEVEAEAGPGPATTLERLSGDGQAGAAGSALPEPLVVRARDRYGNPSRSPVTFSVHGVGGRVSTGYVVPGPDGIASTGWVLATTAGIARVAAHVQGGAVVQFSATVLPGPPEALLKDAGDGQLGYTSGTLAEILVARVVDAFGNGVPDLPVTFTVVEGGGTVAPAATRTDTEGLVRASFALGPSIGSHRVAATFPGAHTGGGSGPPIFEATAASLPPARLAVVAGDGQNAKAGSAVTSAPSVLVSDAVGNPVPGVAVVFSPASGGGSVSGRSPITDVTGVATVGSWILGTTAGTQSLGAAVVGLAPVAILATALPGPPAVLGIVAGDGQSAPAGSPLASPPRVRVADEFGNGVPGSTVSFSVTGGGGSIDATSAVTGTDGIASAVRWTLGSAPGTNTLRASAVGLDPVSFHASATSGAADFALEVRFVGAVSAAQQSAILAAANRWNEIISGDLPSATVSLAAGSCGTGHPGFEGTVDDLIVFVEITDVDGPGGTIGSAGPCWLRSGSLLPIFGAVTLDRDDVPTIEANGRLYDVAVHEFGHVLGIGTLWRANALLQDAGGSEPHFSGASATSEYVAGGGAHPSPVPVENTGGSGTRDAHWREAQFGTEVMTGWINFGVQNSLSRVSIGSLADLGYSVRIGAADHFAALAPPGVPPAPPLRLSETPLGVPIVIH